MTTVYVGPCILTKDLTYTGTSQAFLNACQVPDCAQYDKKVDKSAKFCSSCGSAIAPREKQVVSTRSVANYWTSLDYEQGFSESLAVSGEGSVASTCLIPNKKNSRLNSRWIWGTGEVAEFDGSFNIQKELDTFKEIYAKEIDFIEKLCGKPVQVAWRVILN